MANPDFISFSAEQDSTGAITVNAIGGETANQILVLYVATDGFTPTLSTPNGYVLAQDAAGNAASVNIPGITGMHIFWKRAQGSGLDTPPVLAAPAGGGTVQACHQNSYSNCRTSGTPFHRIVTGTVGVATTTANPPFVVTRLSGCTVFGVASTETDDSLFSSWGAVSPGGALADPGGTIDSGWHSGLANQCSWAGGRGGLQVPGTGAVGSVFGAATRQAQIGFALASLDEDVTSVLPPIAAITASAITPTLQAGAATLTPPPVASTASAVTPTLTVEGGFVADPAAASAAAVAPTFTVGGVSLAHPPVASTASVTVPTLVTTQLQVGAHGSGVVLFAAAGTDPAVFTINSQTSGSMFIAFVGGNMANLTQATAPTDNAGNTWRPLVPQDGANNTGAGAPGAREYIDFPGYGTVVYATPPNASGGVGHTITKVRALEDEVSIDVIEVKNGKTIRAVRWSHPTNGQTIRSQPVTSSNPCVVLGSWWGDSPVNNAPGGSHVVTANNGYTVLGGFGIDYPQGYVQNFYAAKEFPTGTNGGTNITWSSTPAQGAQLWMVEVESDWNDVTPATATAAAVTPSFSGQQEAAPGPAQSTGTAVTPTLSPGSVSVQSDVASAAAAAVTPTMTAGAVNVAPPAVAAAGAVGDPGLTPGAVSLAGPAVPATGSVTTPTLSPGALSITFGPASSTGSTTAPSLIAGGTSFGVPPAHVTASAVTPALIIVGQAQDMAAPAAAATASVIAPTGLQLVSFAPGIASGTLLGPTLAPSVVSLSPAAAAATAVAVANLWVGGILVEGLPTRVIPLTPQSELPRGPGVPAGGGGRRIPFRIN